MRVDGYTKTIGLIGNPVEHTLSPIIHNGISERMDFSETIPNRKGNGSRSVYLPFQVQAEELQDAVKGAYALGVQGLNVTVPYKQLVMEYIEETDEAAAGIGAVNTLVRIQNGHGFRGYNTDWEGLRCQLQDDGISLKGKTVVILGAGGAARAVLYLCLTEAAEKVYILNRTLERAKELALEFGQMGRILPMKLQDAGRIEDTDLVVFQATSIGLYPNVKDVVLEEEAFYSRIAVGIDLIYNPAETRFMQLVEAGGGKAFNALKMLLYQGIRAYELWFDLKVPEAVASEILQELKARLYAGYRENLILIGFMGSGKTTVGRLLADRMDMEFLDTDALLEEKTGKTISEIFAAQGEEEFRRLETELLRELQGHLRNTVLSTGGGMPLREENAGLLKQLGKVVYMSASPEEIYSRLKDQDDRPLLQVEDPLGRIRSLMEERKSRYEAACDFALDTGGEAPGMLVERITKDMRQ